MFAGRALARSPETREQMGRHTRALTTSRGHACVARPSWYLDRTPPPEEGHGRNVCRLRLWRDIMPPIAPHLTAFFRARFPRARGASAHPCDSEASTLPRLCTCASQRVRLTPAHRCLEHSRRILAIPTKRTDLPLVHHLAMAERQAIREAAEVRTRYGLRERAMIPLCCAAGLRVAALLTFPLTAFPCPPTPTVQRQGQGRQERALPLWQQTADDLRAWWAVRGPLTVPAGFLRAHGRTMTRLGFTHRLHKSVRLAATRGPARTEKHVTPHGRRPPCAMVILQATRDLRMVSLWLGHADMQTTDVSLRADPTEKIAALESLMPPLFVVGPLRFQTS
jgi:integrase/recombinase XerD